MLDNAAIVATQVLTLFILIGVGFLIRKLRLINEMSLAQINTILLVIINPCMILSAFQSNLDLTLLSGILFAAISAVATHVIGAVIAKFAFRKVELSKSKVLQFSVVFSNCGFMCLPLLYALLGSTGVLFGSMYVAVFNIGTWTYGVLLLTGNRADINFKRALINPGTITLLIALPLYLLQIKLPGILQLVIGHIAGMNTPVAMMIIGAQLAAIPLLSMFRDKTVFAGSFLRLIIVPGIMLLILSQFPIDRTLLMSCLIPAMAPTAAAATLFATRYKQDVATSTRMIALSTLFSILTMPVILMLTDLALFT